MVYTGQSVKRFEDPRLLTGQGTFLDDLKFPGYAPRRGAPQPPRARPHHGDRYGGGPSRAWGGRRAHCRGLRGGGRARADQAGDRSGGTAASRPPGPGARQGMLRRATHCCCGGPGPGSGPGCQGRDPGGLCTAIARSSTLWRRCRQTPPSCTRNWARISPCARSMLVVTSKRPLRRPNTSSGSATGCSAWRQHRSRRVGWWPTTSPRTMC